MQGEPIMLIYHGKIKTRNLELAVFSMEELEAAVREHGIENIEKVDLAILEVDGNVSVLSNDFTHRTSRRRKFHKMLDKNE